MLVTEHYAFNLICEILLVALYGVALNQKYNNGLGRTKFQRSIEVMRAEWNEHTYLCETELGEHAKHVDINSDADGTPAQIWHDWLD